MSYTQPILAFLKPLESDFRVANVQYNTPAYPLGSLQPTLDFCYVAYPQISILDPSVQPLAYALAVCAELTLHANEACGYNGAVSLIVSRNDRIAYSLSKPGWNPENTRCGASLMRLRRAAGSGIFASDARSACCGSFTQSNYYY